MIYAFRSNLSFLATGGGHGYSFSLGRLQGAIDIDLGFFDSINIDSAARTITIGGSVRSSDVASALQEVGMEMREFADFKCTYDQNTNFRNLLTQLFHNVPVSDLRVLR